MSLARRLLLLGTLVIVASLALAVIHAATQPRIASNEALQRQRSLEQLLPAALRARGPLRFVDDAAGSTVWRDDSAVARVQELTAPDGYAGPIVLLLATDPGGRIIGIDVLAHRETPGLGDRIEPRRSNWLASQFLGRSEASTLRLHHDGGEVDGLTGATITTRAVTQAVARALPPTQAPP